MSEPEPEQEAPEIGESDHDVLVTIRDLLRELLTQLREWRAAP